MSQNHIIYTIITTKIQIILLIIWEILDPAVQRE